MKFVHDPIKVQAFLNSLEAGLCQRENELLLCDGSNEAFSISNTEYISNVVKFVPIKTFPKPAKLKPSWFSNLMKNVKMKKTKHIEDGSKLETVPVCHFFIIIVISLNLPTKRQKNLPTKKRLYLPTKGVFC